MINIPSTKPIAITEELLADTVIDLRSELLRERQHIPKEVSMKIRAEEIEDEISKLQSELEDIQRTLRHGNGLDQ